MKLLNSVLLFIFYLTFLQAYDWPLAPDTSQHKVMSVMGECRDLRDTSGTILDSIHHLHRGIDIDASSGTPVYAIEGDTCYISGSGINIGHFRYYHMTGYLYDHLAFVPEGDTFAYTDGNNHVHLQEADVELRQTGDPSDVNWLNLLRNGGINPYGDSTATSSPQIRNGTDGITLWRQGTNDTIARDTVIDGKIDVSVDAFDPHTESSGGSSGSGYMGVYENYGYIFAASDTLRTDTLIKFQHHKYDTCPSNQTVEYVYAPGSYTSRHIYFITNNPYDTLNPQNYYWNTKQEMR